jgi:hypothetical protein
MRSFTFIAACGHPVTETVDARSWSIYYERWYAGRRGRAEFIAWRASMICRPCAAAQA